MKLRNKILLILVGVACALVLGLYLALFKFGLLEYLVNKKIRDILKGNLPLQVQIGKIGGDYRSYLDISDLRIEYNDGKTSYEMAIIPRIIARYSLLDLYRGKYYFREIAIDSATVNLHKSPEGKWLIPRAPADSGAKAGGTNFEVASLDLNNLNINLVREKDTLSFINLNLKAGVENREGTLSANIDSLSFQASEKKYRLHSARGKVTLTGDNLMCQDFTILTDSSDVKISGQILLTDGLPWKAYIEAPKLNLAEISPYINAALRGDISTYGSVESSDEKLRGNLRISGIFEDRYFDSLETAFQFSKNNLHLDSIGGVILHGCKLEGKGEINFSPEAPEYEMSGSIRHFDLSQLISGGFHSDLNGRINFSGRGLSGSGLTINLFADLGESSFDNFHASSAIGDMTITSDSIVLQDEFLVKYKDNLFSLSGKLEYAGLVQIDGSTMFDDISAFNGLTFIKRAGGRADLNFQITGNLKNPDLTGQLTSDSLWLYDIYSSQAALDFQMTHFLYDRKGMVDLFLNNGLAYNHPYDTIRVKMQVDSQKVYIDDAFIFSSEIHAGGIGMLTYSSYPQKLLLDSISLDVMGLEFRNDSTIAVEIDSSGYDLSRCQLLRPAGRLTAEGRINYDESMNLDIDVEKLDILPIVKLITSNYNLTGLMSGRMKIQGAFASPSFNYSGKIDSLSYNNFILGDLKANLKYDSELVSIDSITIDSRTGFYTARGTLPIDLSLTSKAKRLLDKEQNISITATDTRMDAVSLLLQEVENLKGDFRADFKLTGTPRNPKIDGEISLKQGRLKIYDLTYPLDSVNVSMKLNNQTVSIESATAICSNGKKIKGRLTGQGEIIVQSIDKFQYNVKIKLTSFPVQYELGDISALVNANLKIYGETPPTVYGDVTITSATYRENFAKENEGWIVLTSLQGDKTWDLNLNVDAPSNLWVKNDDIDAEFGGALNFIREKGNYRYIGSLEILRGKGYLADRAFTLEPGGTINYEDIGSPNPRLDIYASTKIRGAPSQMSGEAASTGYDLRVHITGTIDEPTIEAAEASQGAPQFTTQEIIPLIFMDYYGTKEGGTGAGRGFVGERLTSGISGFLSSQMGQIGSRTLGVETFEIDPVYGDKLNPLGTRLTLGFYTHPNLYIYGTSAISGVTGQEVGFEYRFKRFLVMEGRRDEYNLYHLLLNFSWDY